MLSRIFSQLTGKSAPVPAPSAQPDAAAATAAPARPPLLETTRAPTVILRDWLAADAYPAYSLAELLSDPVRAQAAVLIATRGDVAQLQALLRQLTERDPPADIDLMLLAEALLTRGSREQAIPALEAVIDRPGKIGARACQLLGEEIFHTGQFKLAAPLLDRAAALAPEALSVQLWSGLLRDTEGRPDAALAHFRRAVALRPVSVNARVGLAMALIRCGALQKGLSEWVTGEYLAGCYGAQPACPVWDGRPLERDRLLILTVNYFGDVIQFLRFARYLRAREPHARLSIQIQPALASLAAHTGLFEAVYTGEVARDGFDWQVTQTHLALLLDVPLEEVSRFEPYLQIPAEQVLAAASWLPARRPGRLRVGLRWAGMPKLADGKRSLPFAMLQPLFDVPDVDWVALVENPAMLAGLGAHPLIDVSEHLVDFCATGALMSHLDLIITVDTSIVHLAGALKLPAWLLPRPDPEWRWGATGASSPWYSSVRIFRHPQVYDPGAVVSDMAVALAELAERHAGKTPLPEHRT
jgi:tetratricopeptide (TPR) repeat protein